MSTQRIAKLAAVATASGFMTVGVVAATTGTAHAVQNVDVTRDYSCVATANGLNIGTFTVGVQTEVELPDTYVPGEAIASRGTDITLILPDGLRQATRNFAGGRSASGNSTNTDVVLVNSGVNTPVRIQNLSAPATAIPAGTTPPWTVPATGTVPEVNVPAQASGDTQVLLPTEFFVNATIFKGEDGPGTGDSVPGTLDCDIVSNTTANRLLATIPEQGASASPVAADINVETDYATPVGVTLAATDTDSAQSDLTFAPEEPANGTLSGTGANRTYTPDEDFAGTDTFDYTVTDEDGNVDTGIVTVEVAKSASTVRVKAPAKSKAGKPVKMVITVASDATATGKVTVKLGAKTVGSGNVKNGKATVTVPGKATKALKGKKTFTVTYAGNAVVAKDTVKAKVTFTK